MVMWSTKVSRGVVTLPTPICVCWRRDGILKEGGNDDKILRAYIKSINGLIIKHAHSKFSSSQVIGTLPSM